MTCDTLTTLITVDADDSSDLSSAFFITLEEDHEQVIGEEGND